MSCRLRLNFILSMWLYSCLASFVESSIPFLLYCISTLVKNQVAMNSSFPGGVVGKESAVAQCKRHKKCQFSPRVGKISWRRARQPTPVFLLENPMGRGAWQATFLGVAKSRTQLNMHTCVNVLFGLYILLHYIYIYIYIWIYNLMPVLWSQESQEGWVAQICFFFKIALSLVSKQ